MKTNLASVLAPSIAWGQRKTDYLPTGIYKLDKLIQGFPRGAISEVIGPESSGRATLLHSLLATATRKSEICAYVDVNESFDPCSAAGSGVVLSQIVWIRCGNHLEHAFKTADLLIHAGGFGVVVLDLSRVPDQQLRRIPLSYWYRFRGAIENTPTILPVVGRDWQAKSCAALMVELTRKNAVWAGAPGFYLLQKIEFEAACRKPVRPVTVDFAAYALA
jgi:hypothetical protein